MMELAVVCSEDLSLNCALANSYCEMGGDDII